MDDRRVLVRTDRLESYFAMEPLHITEFASKRYYEKLDQLPKDHQQPQAQEESHGVEALSSKFILPIRQAEQHGHVPPTRQGEHLRSEKEKEKEKRGLFGRLRSKQSSASVPEPLPLRRPSFTSAATASSTGETPAVKRKRYVVAMRRSSFRCHKITVC